MGDLGYTADAQYPLADNDLPEGVDARLVDEVVNLVRSTGMTASELDDVEAFDIISAEEQICHYVRSGDAESLMRVPVPEPSTPPEGVSRTSHLRYLLISLNAICLHAALEGGVSKKIAYGLNRQLSTRILTCSSEEELAELSRSRLIVLSYCLLVRELSIPNVTDKDIVRAIRFIHDHHHEQLSVRQIAESVSLSPEYLSAKFKRETGTTVSTYITRTRVDEAKALLRFSSLSIGEIAAQLAFSSQSYFQTVFKRETGTTPQQYRQSVGWKDGQIA